MKRPKPHPVSGGLHLDIKLDHTADFELYGNAFSHCSRKIRIALAELNIPYLNREIELIETGSYQTLSPEYLAINPAGVIPTLVHRGHPIYESDDILRYLVNVSGADSTALIPADSKKQHEMENWINLCAISSDDPMRDMDLRPGACIPGLTLPLFMVMMQPIRWQNIMVGIRHHPDKGRPLFFLLSKFFGISRFCRMNKILEIIMASRDCMSRHLANLEVERVEASENWLVGEEFSLADITMGCLLQRLDESNWLTHFQNTQPLSNVISYFEAVKARPSWKEAITDIKHPAIYSGAIALKAAVEKDNALHAALYGT